MMSTREFIQHLLLNAELDDKVCIEVTIPDNIDRKHLSFEPAHVTRIEPSFGDPSETLIECKPYKEDI
jgi:hypothetical protein